MKNIDAVLDWMTGGIAGAKTSAEVVARFCPDLVAAGIPVDRCQALVRTLHPHIAARSFLWVPDEEVRISEHSYEEIFRPGVEELSYIPVFRTGTIVRKRLNGSLLEPDLVVLANEGYTDFFAGPLKFISGQLHGIFFATKNPAGFSDDDIDALTRVLPPLSRIAEILALSRTATNLLNTYVGHDAGARILAGQIQRGETKSIHAVIWFSDLRGFTAMSSELEPVEMISILNEVFDCQVPAIERHGGQVLKFIGDGMLAIFSCSAEENAARVESAITAAREAFSALEGLNQRRTKIGSRPVQFGLALHIGEVSYGNIGSTNRLDFTCIGSAVNLAARLETLTSKLNKNIVVSEEAAALASTQVEPLGEFILKGVGAAVRAFGLK